ncbi:MAG: radical SAM family heme chaperone HemW [Gammaproteobacteria bacterium]
MTTPFNRTIPLSLYIHLPWCIQKCPYCDFNSYGITQHPMTEQAYVAALLEDFTETLPLIWGRRLVSIFFGGGTPSLFSAESIAEILNGIQTLLPFNKEHVEITLEANPGTFEYEKFKDFKAAGINRISLGVQSFDDQQLKRLGRVHSSDNALEACRALRELNVNFNIDLMYGLPHQTIESALSDLHTAITCEPKHLSWYHLTMEPNTVFYQRPPEGLPNDDFVADMEDAGRAYLASAGLQRYEVSAYAREGFESVHNLNYWTFGDYVGIGAGAHGKITDASTGVITRHTKQKVPANYLNPELPFTSSTRALNADELPVEFMMNALRLKNGFEWDEFESRTGLSRAVLMPALEHARDDGFVLMDDQRVWPTDHGYLFLNNLLGYF